MDHCWSNFTSKAYKKPQYLHHRLVRRALRAHAGRLGVVQTLAATAPSADGRAPLPTGERLM